MIEASGLDPKAFSSDTASLQLPEAYRLNEFINAESFSYPEMDAFFVVNQSFLTCYSPYLVEKFFAPATSTTISVVLGQFETWLAGLVAERESVLNWEEASCAKEALTCLTRQQLSALYPSLSTRNLAVDLWKWSNLGHLSCRLQSTKFPFYFELNYQIKPGPPNLTIGKPPRQSLWYNVSKSPGEMLNIETKPKLSWQGVIDCFDRWAASVAEDLPAEQKLRAPREAAAEQTHRISKLTLSRVRMFRNQELAFGDNNLILLLGNNGAGKSTVLRCFALGSTSRTEAQELLNQEVARITSPGSEATVKLTWTLSGVVGNGDATNRLEISLNAEGQQELVQLNSEASHQGFPSFVAGYGSNRGYYGASERHKIATWGLFNYGTALANPELVVRRLYDHFKDENGFNQALKPIYELLGQPNIRILKPSQGQVWVQKSDDEKIAFDGWADGYRLTLAWLLDLMDRALAKKALGPDGPEGLLLLDEVEQHLHPKLQIGFLSSLQKAFPRLQIVATTHSPSVALGVDPSCVRVVRNNGQESTIEQVPDYSGYSIEELVESPQVFDAEIYPPELAKRQERYKELLSKQGLSEQEQAEAKELGRELWDLVPTET